MFSKSRVSSLAGVLAGVLITIIAFEIVKSEGPAPVMGAVSAERQKVYDEIQAAFGFVPGFFKTIPDNSIGYEWKTMKAVQMDPGAIPNKYRELIGLAVASAKGCEYCTYFHTQFARLNGATDAEIEDAIHYAKSNVGWSTYLHGIQYDFNQFKQEVDQICSNAKASQATKK